MKCLWRRSSQELLIKYCRLQLAFHLLTTLLDTRHSLSCSCLNEDKPNLRKRAFENFLFHSSIVFIKKKIDFNALRIGCGVGSIDQALQWPEELSCSQDPAIGDTAHAYHDIHTLEDFEYAVTDLFVVPKLF